MKQIAFIQDGALIVGTYGVDHLPTDVDYVLLDREIAEPIESWYIENGQVKIDQEKLIKLNRKNMPTLSPVEFDIKLDQYKLYDAVQDLIKSNRQLSIAYNRATFFSRTDPFIESARIALGLTDEQVDSMWEQSLTI